MLGARSEASAFPLHPRIDLDGGGDVTLLDRVKHSCSAACEKSVDSSVARFTQGFTFSRE